MIRLKRKVTIIGSVLAFAIGLLLVPHKSGVTETDAKVAVIENGTPVELHEFQTFATVYTNGHWASAQGLRASIALPDVAEELSEVIWNEDVKIQISEAVELYYIRIFDEKYEQVASYFSELEELQTFFDEADQGSYYVAIAVNWDGKYILKGNDRERFGSEFVFELVKK